MENESLGPNWIVNQNPSVVQEDLMVMKQKHIFCVRNIVRSK